jgi:Na+/H+ antiporter NhaC
VTHVLVEEGKIEFWGGVFVPFLPLLTFIASSVYMMVSKKLSIELMLVSFMVGVIIMLLLSRDFTRTWEVFEKGMASRISAIIVALYTLVAIYSGLIQVSQLANGIIWLAAEIGVSGAQFTVFTFLACSIFATATGSTFATKVVLGFVLYPVGLVVGSDPGVLLGAIFAGAALGDNIGPVSDTTILSASLQTYKNKDGNADIPGVVKSRLKYALIAAAICVVFYALRGSAGGAVTQLDTDLLEKNSNARGLLMLLPMVLLLYVAIKKRDIFKALVTGIVTTFVLGLAADLFSFNDLLYVSDAGKLTGGLIQGMKPSLLGMIILAVLFLGEIEVLKSSGAIDDLLQFFSRFTKTPRSTEITIWLLGTILTPLSGCNPTGVVLLVSPLSDRMGKNVGLHPYRRANMIDAMATSWCYMLPFGLSMLLTFALMESLEYDFMVLPTPMEVFLAQIYGWAILAVMLISAITGYGRVYEGSDGEPVKANICEQRSLN